MSISSIAESASEVFRPRPLPPGVDDLVIDSRRGTRIGMRIAGGVATGGALIGGTIMSDQTRDDWKPALITGAVGGALLGVGSFFVRDSVARVLEVNLPNLQEALTHADGYDRAVGVLEHEDKFHLVDLNALYDLDHVNNRRLAEFRVGDGQVPFTSLVTQDGDQLDRVSASSTRGYRNLGTVAPRLELNSLVGKSSDEIDRALIGRRIGTDWDHAPQVIGPRVGSASGYTNADAMFNATFGETGDEAIGVRIGNRIHAFRSAGPTRQFTELRGTEIQPYTNITAASRKSTWQGMQAGEGFRFLHRVQPFTLDEPIGQQLDMAGVEGVPSRWLSTHGSLDDAERQVRSYAWRDYDSQGRIDTANYAIIEGDTGRANGGDFHVYRRGGGATGIWEPELGGVRGMSWVNEETRTQEHAGTDETIREHQRRSMMYLRNEERDDWLIKDTPWYTYQTERVPHQSGVL
jgi:hypothetical protein